MAAPVPTLDATPAKGMDLRTLDKGGGSPFIGNVVPRNGEFAVREGFGLVRQYSTTLNGGVIAQTGDYGIGPCIGAYAFRTPFGHDQVVAVHSLFAFSGDLRVDDRQRWVAGSRGRLFAGVGVFVHDLHSGRMFEFVLHNQNAHGDDLQRVMPHGSTRYNEDRAQWFVPQAEPTWATFAPMLGRLVILIEGCGLWTYRAVDAPVCPDRKLNSVDRALVGACAGETSGLSPLELCNGFYVADGMAYTPQAFFTPPTAMCLLGNRMVYASGGTVYFSDANRPDNILVGNVQTIPTQESVTLLAAVRGSLFIATATQCWVYQPSSGDALVSAGQLVNLAHSMGCAAPRAAVLADDGVIFADRSGIYQYNGGADLRHLSAPIDRLWTDSQSLQLPWTDYYTASGVTALADPQPPSRIGVREQTPDFRFAWDDVRKQLLAVLDDVALVYTDGFGWSTWAFFSHAGNGLAVQARANLAKPVAVPVRDSVYLVAGPYLAEYEDPTPDLTATNRSCGLYLLGRGGALDASTDAWIEDERCPTGGWIKSAKVAPGVGPAIFLGKPILVPADYSAPFGSITSRSYWIPVYLCRDPSVGLVSAYSLEFEFDNTSWRPSFIAGGNPEIDFVLPTNRLASVAGYAQGAPVGGVSEVQCYQGGAPNVAGNSIHVYWDGTLGAWGPGQPNMSVGNTGPDLVLLLPFTYIGTADSFSIPRIGGSGLAKVNAAVADLYYWTEGSYLIGQNDLEARKQPVDWAVKTPTFALKGDEFKVRGVFITAMHYGSATSKAVNGWPFGPLNSATSSDYRDYSAQSIDFAQTPPGNSEQTGILQQQRIQATLTGNVVPQDKVGNGVAKWSSTADSTKGNLLIDDAAVDTLATTDGTQGTRASVMLHGTINAESEAVRIGRIEVAVRPTGGRRRWFNR